MTIKEISLKQALNKAYRLIKPKRPEMEAFKKNLITLLGQIDEKESEENVKIHLMNFLRDTFYNPTFHVATKGRTDFVVHTGKDAVTPAGVLFEVKRPLNTADMVSKTNLNAKALHELMLYFLRERIEHKNNDIRQVVITNIYEWFIFDASVFERLFHKNTQLVKQYKEWVAGQKVSSNTDLFYKEIAKPFLESLDEEIPFTWFDIREFEKPLRNAVKEDDNKLIALFKVISPTHLLKLPFANDSNSLDKGFYAELLHIIGLEEVKEGSKKIIRRKKEGQRNEGSLLENTIAILDTESCLHKVQDLKSYGETKDDQLFSVGLELCITWVNRILFLKLLEAQLLKYHKGNNQYRFLNFENLPQYDEVYKLFFQVLARRHEERIEKVQKKFSHIPYLNSSLFEFSEMEDATIKINMLDGTAELDLISSTVLRNDKNKAKAEKLNTLQYFFEFLEAYDFASEGSEEIQEEGKTLINASVLGLIFEKINGYKDGSIFTPGFITMYMCRQSIRQAVVNKFKETYKWKTESFEDLYNYISEDRSIKKLKEYNELINSMTICDPAVGSGHFLVSALNELIAIKAEMGMLISEHGTRLSEIEITLENDELIITDRQGDIFQYIIEPDNNNKNYIQPWKQAVQKTLFHEKQTIIENCLFGVDINPKSVQICRLRLWIELLKNAYYIIPEELPNNSGRIGNELQTLPNIDINIKCGNSLINRFLLDEDLRSVFKQGKYSVETYKLVVQTYKDSKSKEEKSQLQNFVKELKEQFKTIVYNRDPLRKKIAELRGQLMLLENNIDLFGEKKKTDQELDVDKKRLLTNIKQKEKELEEKENNKIYNNAFEWRFEFPEVLDSQGSYIGFDIIIGNPPYIGEKEMSFFFDSIKKIPEWSSFYRRRTNIYYFFLKRGNEILKNQGVLSFIIPREFLTADWANKLRHYLANNTKLNFLIDFDTNSVFEDAGTTSLIINSLKSGIESDYSFDYYLCSDVKRKIYELDFDSSFQRKSISFASIDISGVKSWAFNQSEISGDDFFNLGKYFDVVQGLVTGVDKVTPKHILSKLCDAKFLNRGIFVLSESNDILHKEKCIYLKINDKWVSLSEEEKYFIKPFVYSVNIKKWLPTISDDYVIYFGNNEHLPEAIISYLSQFKEILINRATIVEGKISASEFDKFTIEEIKKKYSSAGAVQKIMKRKQWFKPLYERADYDFDSIKFIVNSKNKTDFSISTSPCYSSGGGLGGQNYIFPKLTDTYFKEVKKHCSLIDYFYFIGGILNSDVISNFIIQGKYNQLSTQKIAEIQLYKLDFEKDNDVFTQIVKDVKNILSKLQESENTDISKEQDSINLKVSRLYNLS